MRLLHTKTLDLHEFSGSSIPPYAILSHRWGDEEVTFDDVVKGRAPLRGGNAKIQSFARLADEDGFTYCVSEPPQ
jgi:hypothetical protein